MSEPNTASVRIRLDGERFQGGRLPVSSLEELKRYERMVREAAAHRWLADNPGRKNVPAGFRHALNLTIVEVGDGSAVPTLALDHPTAEWEPYYEGGFADVDEVFARLTQGLEIPESIDITDLREFRDFGKSLHEDETIQLRPYSDNPITYSLEVRREVADRLELAPLAIEAAIPNVRRSGAVAGRLGALDADLRSFRLRLLGPGGGTDIEGEYAQPELTADLRRVLDSTAVAPVVRITGELVGPPEGVPERIASVASVELFEVDGMPSSFRLIELATLEHGWHDGYGEPVQFVALDAARDILRRLNDESIPTPSVFPLEDGGIQLEWASPQRVANVEISPELVFSLFRLTVETREVESSETSELAAVIEFARQVTG